MKIIPHSMIKNVITQAEAFNLVRDNFIRQKNFLLPPKISIKYGEADFMNTMPCVMLDDGIAGVKVVSRHLGRTPTLTAKILLFDSNTGDALALLDGDYITVLRTGAVAALAAETFAVKGYKRIGIWGLGNTARATFDVLSVMKNSVPLEVFLLRYKNQAENFVDTFSHLNNVKFFICDTYEEVAENSQVLISCVSDTKKIFCDVEKYPAGILILPVQSKGFQNCDLVFDKIFADYTAQIKDFKYFPQFSKLNYGGELTDILTGKVAGRTSNTERILSYNIGIATHDLRFANEIYKRVGNLCEDFDLESPTEKFYYESIRPSAPPRLSRVTSEFLSLQSVA